MCLNDPRLNTVDFDEAFSTGVTEENFQLPFFLNSWKLSCATENCRVRLNRSLVIPAASVKAYFYDQSAGTYTDLGAPSVAAPWVLNDMTTLDKIFICADGDLISALEFTIGDANVNASVMTVKYATQENNFITLLPASAWSAMGKTDGTALGGATFGQSGRLVLEYPPQQKVNSISPSVLVGGVWYEITVSAALDATTSVTGLVALGPHRILVAAAAAEEGSSRFDKLYYRVDANTGTLTVQGQA